MMIKIRKVGVLTSGGDAPGMNAVIRSIYLTGKHYSIQIYGIVKGYDGLILGNIFQLSDEDVKDIIDRGGTILKTARSEMFRTVEGRQKAVDQITKHQLDALIVIGGNGTFAGALDLSQVTPIPIIGVPATIDNDLYGIEFTIGNSTAIQTAVEAIDKIKDTASSHHNLFFVEVMGRDTGYIALYSAVASGANAVLLPESNTDLKDLYGFLNSNSQNHYSSGIIIVAEGDETGGAYKLVEQIRPCYPNYDIILSILGHIQRGGSPIAYDRILATLLGNAAINAILENKRNGMVTFFNNRVQLISFIDSLQSKKQLDSNLLYLMKICSSNKGL